MFKYKKHREIPELASHMRVKVETLQNENFFLFFLVTKQCTLQSVLVLLVEIPLVQMK